MKQFFPAVYQVCKFLFLVLIAVYLISFLSIRESYFGSFPSWLFDRLHIVVLWSTGVFALISFFQHFAASSKHLRLLEVLFVALALCWTGVVFYLFFMFLYA